MTDLTGQYLGRYHILRRLGEGGMASVYEATDPVLHRQVAIKVILPLRESSEMFVERFNREARALAQLTHANIVKIWDYGDQDGLPYLVMEYISGGTLKDKLTKPMPWREAVRLVIPIANALASAHEQKIIHRDVKPANILITPSGEPMLSDFGIAKILQTDETTDLMTSAGVGIGTPVYMAPEQALGEPIDPRADIYSLGVVLYEMVTGRAPYRADTPAAVLLKKSTEPLPRPKLFVPDLPTSVENILFCCLQRNPEYRYTTCQELVAALENSLQEIPQQRRPLLLAGLLFGAAILLVSSAVFLVIRFVPPQTPTSVALLPTPTTELVVPPVLPTLTESPSALSENTATPSARISPRDGMEMVYVPAGDFLHGASPQDIDALLAMCPNCQKDSLTDAGPQSVIYLDEFWIDKTEVTNAQFEKFVAETGYLTSAEKSSQYAYIQDLKLKDFIHAPGADWRHPRGKGSDILGKEQYPVTQVSWQDADAYCHWAGRRLPTEAEWEKAARGTDDLLFPWGNRTPTQEDLNFNFYSKGALKVGSFPSGASIYGVLDMSGNLWEWVQDYYSQDYYAAIPSSNPQGPDKADEDEDRVLRGGSWASELDPYLEFVTTFYRLYNHDYISSDVLGFRCATSQ